MTCLSKRSRHLKNSSQVWDCSWVSTFIELFRAVSQKLETFEAENILIKG